MVLILTSCATATRPAARAPALPVPFTAQKADYCGPAALAMVANYYGHAVTQDQIADAIYLPNIRGTLTTELTDYARRYHLWTRQYRGDLADLHHKLAAGIPLIVLGKLGDCWHYFIVLRDGDPLIVHSDNRARHEMRREDFIRWWDRAGRWTLLICPPERATWNLSAAEHNDLGVFLERDHQLVAAADHYRVAAALDPGNSYLPMNLGNVLRKQGQLREALAAFIAAGENPDALNNRADVLCELGEQLDDAATLCLRAIELLPAHRAYYLDTLGSIRLKQGRRAEAVAAFDQALAATTDRQETLRATIRQHRAAAEQSN